MIQLSVAGCRARDAGDLAAAQALHAQAGEIALRAQPESVETGVVCHTATSWRRNTWHGASFSLNPWRCFERVCAVAAETAVEITSSTRPIVVAR